MSRPAPTRRLPIFDALRSNDRLKKQVVQSSFGPISEPIHDAMLELPRFLQKDLLKELTTAALFLDDHLTRTEPKKLTAPRHTKAAVLRPTPQPTRPNAAEDIEPIEVVKEFEPCEFGMDTFPMWLQWFLATNDVNILRTLKPAEAEQQRTVLVGTVIEVTPAGKLRWSFNTNPSKTGFAFLSNDQLDLFKKGDVWLFNHNGCDNIDSALRGGRKLTASEGEQLARTLAATWRRYH